MTRGGQSLGDRFFRDTSGKVVIGQRPNTAIVTAVIFYILTRLISRPLWLHGLCHIIATVALLIWALLEIVSGVNWFRRLLGSIVLLVVIISLLA